eukprot:CAMPEP_0117443518 /NCGR_PEP_ID=MMETSP0759-20121206/4735_1 /TAXON_ID=63605 /ORGANISM="Percolomonas cosmopolitus, Strain WS" /LENGTH=100 /DNA_ID=CAMNT_0005235493 /DNA_START=90 /DNA_END=392 /DNA_ORIENTATION=+
MEFGDIGDYIGISLFNNHLFLLPSNTARTHTHTHLLTMEFGDIGDYIGISLFIITIFIWILLLGYQLVTCILKKDSYAVLDTTEKESVWEQADFSEMAMD